ncbi:MULTISPECIES: hypothetical protein [Pseudomonas]|uniref:Uncharacterized protein n=1 Tax=Pseudomonas wuhanensis TaxID=2954098 RepID=A0ABY9GX63_9PSED|nr:MULTISPECIES: hypothetical protein [unclassified Pseudomonas]WLI14367.1 hypothetical protein PSH65_09690 [Pseudomonas sp. FP603]WLI20283.1 hypothetical protein PSH88_09710 [Pseudomonas sp. FP607]
MAYWDSYGYPESDPKVWITFGPQKDGLPQVAFLAPILPEDDSPKADEYYQEVAGRWTDELAAHEELDKIAQALIEQKCL